MINFKKETWYDKSDTTNRIPISATHLNRIEDAISDLVQNANNMTNHYWKRSKRIETDDIEVHSLVPNSTFKIWETSYQTAVIYYSKSVNIKTNELTGEKYLELDNPSSTSGTYSNYTGVYHYELSNSFFIIKDTEFAKNTLDGGTLYLGGGAWQTTSYDGGYGIYLSASQVSIKIGYELLDYVNSSDRNAYTDGWNDSELLMYEYLGVPYENSKNPSGMDFGYYYGNGLPKTIKTRRKPRCIWLKGVVANVVDAIVTDAYGVGDYSQYIQINNDGFTLNNSQLYLTGYKYTYIVFY